MRVDIVLVQVELLKLGMTLDSFQDLFNALVANSVELKSKSKKVRVLGQEFAEVLDRLIIQLVVVEINFLDHVALVHGVRETLETCVGDQVILYR